tara:strand:+ start:1747 stop:2331 length:585 start_codon:yes stop_codon:yes gene_type:complete
MKRHCTYSSHRTRLGKIWHFLWHVDSWESFIADAILVIVLGKFVLFPILGAILGTSLPMVAVVSSSMDHNDIQFDQWWENNKEFYIQKNITEEQFSNFLFRDGFDKGDAMILVGKSNYEVGDTIVFRNTPNSEPIIHRVVEVGSDYVATKGDNNSGQLNYEKHIKNDKIIGKATIRAPLLGWVKVIFLESIGKL